MAEMKASVILDLVDRISRPMGQIQRRFSRLGQNAGLQRLTAATRQVGANFNNAVSQAGRLTGRLALIGGAAAGAAWGFERFVSGVTDVGTEALQASRRLGTSVEWLTEWQAIGRHFGVGNDALTDGLKELTMRADEFVATSAGPSAEAFKRLGLTRDELRATAGNTEELFELVQRRMRDVGNTAARQRIADELFGGQGAEQMVEMLSSSSEELRRLAAEAHAAGVVMDEEMAQSMRRYTRNMDGFKQSLFGLRIEIVDELLPGLTGWLERMRELIKANREDITKRVREGLISLWEALKDVGAALKWTSDLLGGWERVAIAVGAVLAGPLILSVVQLGWGILKLSGLLAGFALKVIPVVFGATKGLGLALLGLPVSWVIAGVAAIAGAVYLIYKHWDGIASFFTEKFAAVTQAFDQDLVLGVLTALAEFNPASLISDAIKEVVEYLTGVDLYALGDRLIGRLWQGIIGKFNEMTAWLDRQVSKLVDWMPDWAQDRLGLEGVGGRLQPGRPVLGDGGSDIDSLAGRAQRQGVGELGLLRIEVNQDGRVRSVTPERRRDDVDIDVDLGLGGLMP